MKYLRHYSYIKENKDYFKSILKKELADPNEVDNNRDEVIRRLISRAKLNLDSNPSEEKLNNWKEDINSIIDKYIKNNYSFNFKSEKGDFNYESPIRIKNSKLVEDILKDKTSYIYKTIIEIPDYYVSQVGYDTVLNYIKVEENTLIRHNKVKINVKRYEGEDEIDFLIRKSGVEGNWETISYRLIEYFLKRLSANIPEDKVYTKEEMVKFISTYVEKFLYNYLVPMSKH